MVVFSYELIVVHGKRHSWLASANHTLPHFNPHVCSLHFHVDIEVETHRIYGFYLRNDGEAFVSDITNKETQASFVHNDLYYDFCLRNELFK